MLYCYEEKEVKNDMKKGVPKHNGTGGGIRANQGRGGCAVTRPRGRGRNRR